MEGGTLFSGRKIGYMVMDRQGSGGCGDWDERIKWKGGRKSMKEREYG